MFIPIHKMCNLICKDLKGLATIKVVYDPFIASMSV